MTLMKGPDGVYEGDFRFSGLPRLHLRLRTTKRSEAKERHDAVVAVYRMKERGRPLIVALKSRAFSVEALTDMVRNGEPLVLPPSVVASLERSDPWGTVDEAVARYLEWVERREEAQERSSGTRKIAGYQLQRFQNFVHDGIRTGDRRITGFPETVIEAYRKSLSGAPANTITTYVSRVGTLWNWLARQEERSAREQQRKPRALYSPLDPELTPRTKLARQRMLDETEVQLLLVATPEPMLFPVGCALLAGLRLNEVLHLRPTLDVDLETATLAVQRQEQWKPKTKRSIRVVPMAPLLAEYAAVHVAKYASGAWMCPGFSDGTVPLNDLTFRQQFKKVVQRAGLPYGRDDAQGVTFHTLRHTFASHAVMRGVDLYTVAQLLGDSLKTVEETYAHLSKDHKRAAIAKVAAAFQFPSDSADSSDSATAGATETALIGDYAGGLGLVAEETEGGTSRTLAAESGASKGLGGTGQEGISQTWAESSAELPQRVPQGFYASLALSPWSIWP